MNSVATTAGGMLLMLVVIATAAGVVRFSPFYRRELTASGSRELPLDGLRGMAALMVMVHHAALFYTQLTAGKWGYTQSRVLQLCGPAGVMIFFMLTGYLFWNKARKSNGKFDIWKLWRGRVYRIGPLYLFSVSLIMLIAIVKTEGRVLAVENWIPLLNLMTLGAADWQMAGNLYLPDLDARVVWTLWYEWRFYMILPFVARFSAGRKTFWFALVMYVVVAFGFCFGYEGELWLVFVLGMLSAVLLDDQRLRKQLQHPAATVIALTVTLVLCAVHPGDTPSIALAGALFPVFVVVAAGNTFFGFLTHRAILCLGAISYSLYLLHGVMFYLATGVLKAIGWTVVPQLYYWPVITATAMITTLLCATTYRWIEHPFLSVRRNVPSAANQQP